MSDHEEELQEGGNEAGAAALPPVPGIKPPNPLILDNNVLDNWKLFKQKWQIYSVISKLDRQPQQYQVALLLHTLGDAALKVYNGIHFQTPEAGRSVEEIVTAFDNFAIGEINETYERFVFNNRIQEEGETFESFKSSLFQLVLTCNHCDNCRDSILRDRIVIGIRDYETQKHLLKEHTLTLNAAIDICRASEKAMSRGKVIRPEVSNVVVNKVTEKFKAKSYKRPKERRPPIRDCKFCNSSHPMKKELCPAYGKVCSICKEENHFAAECPKACKVRAVREDYSDSSEDQSDTEEWINAVRSSKPHKQIRCRMLINNGKRDVTFQVDTGSSVNTLPQKYAPTPLEQCDSTLIMWNDSTLKPLGKCRNRKRYNAEFIIIDNGHTPLIGLSAAQQMGLVTIEDKNMELVSAITTTPPTSASILEEYGEVFDGGLGSLPGETRLQVREDTIPVTMPDRRTPISVR